MRRKLEKLELRLKLLENKINALKSPGQHMSRKTPPIEAALPLNSGTQNEEEKRYTSEPRSLGGNQTRIRSKCL